MNDSSEQYNHFIPQNTNDEITAHTCWTKQRILFLVVCGGIAIVLSAIIGTIKYVTADEPSPPERDTGHYDLQSNPFRERCQNGSKFVTKYCSLDDGSVSKHKCLECLHGDLLPNFCFCDVGHQCERVDAPMKQTCSWCKNNCPCLNDGNCSCVHPNTTGEHIRCSCPTGYGGRYCEVVLVRLCKTTLKSKDLADCAVSLYEECYIISGIGKSYMTCKIYTGDSVGTSIPNCTEVTTRR